MHQDELFERLKVTGISAPFIPRLPTEQEVDEGEMALGIRLPPSYRAYLLTISDVLVGSYWPLTIHHEMTGGRLLDQTRDLHAVGLPLFLIPFESSQDGDAFCFDLRSTGPEFAVVRWLHEDATFDTYHWPDFLSWIETEWLPTIKNN